MKRKLLVLTMIIAICFAFMPTLPSGQANAKRQAITKASELKGFFDTYSVDCNVKGYKVTLKENANLDTSIYLEIEKGKTITLDLNGHSITSTTEDKGAIEKLGQGKLIIMDVPGAKLDNDRDYTKIAATKTNGIYVEAGEVVIKDVEIDCNFQLEEETTEAIFAGGDETSNITIENCLIKGMNNGIIAHTNSNFSIKNSQIQVSKDADYEGAAVGVYGDNAKVEISDSNIYAECPYCNTTGVFSRGKSAKITLKNVNVDCMANCVNAESGTINIYGGIYNQEEYYDNIYVSGTASVLIGGNAILNGSYGVYVDTLTATLTLKKCSITVNDPDGETFCCVPDYDTASIIPTGFRGTVNPIFMPEYGYSMTNEPISVIALPQKLILSDTSYVYDGKVHTPMITVKDYERDNIGASKYDKKFSSSVRKAVGKYTVTVKFKDNFAGVKDLSASYKILPKKAGIKSVTVGKKKMTVKASTKASLTGGDHYKIGYRVKGTTAWKYVTTTLQTKTIKSLKKGKKYQVKVYAYKKVNGVTYKGAWSSIKTTATIK